MIRISILTPETSRTVEAEAVFLPGALSPFEVLHSHAPIISSLEAGRIRWRTRGGEEEGMDIQGGIMQLKDDEMKVCVQL